jgi:tRNA-modifying protein YgfZ
VSDSLTVELDAQYRQLREECGLLDRSERGMLTIRGSEAAEYLQGQLTNDVEALEPGEGCYAALLDRKGHLQADMRVLRPAEAPDLWIDTEAQAAGVAKRHLETYKIGRDVEVDDVGSDRSILSLIGPATGAVAGTPSLPLHACEATTVLGVECIAVGSEDGTDLLCAAEDRDRLSAALLEAGAGGVDAEAAEILRIEAGRPRFGAEMSDETMPAEAGIVERAVSFTKGCYIGQEPVARLHHMGRPNRHLRGLRLSAPIAADAALTLGGKEVGRVGSACVSPAHGPIALAIVRREAELGAELLAGEDGVTAQVVDLPFG